MPFLLSSLSFCHIRPAIQKFTVCIYQWILSKFKFNKKKRAFMLCKLKHNNFKISKCILYLKCTLKIHVFCIWKSLSLKSILHFGFQNWCILYRKWIFNAFCQTLFALTYTKIVKLSCYCYDKFQNRLKIIQGCYSNNRIKFPDFSLTILRKIFV